MRVGRCHVLLSHRMRWRKIKENICKIPKLEAFYARARATSSRDLISFQVDCCHSKLLPSAYQCHRLYASRNSFSQWNMTLRLQPWLVSVQICLLGTKCFCFLLFFCSYTFIVFVSLFFILPSIFTTILHYLNRTRFIFGYAEEAAVEQAAELSSALLNFSWCAQYRGTNP